MGKIFKEKIQGNVYKKKYFWGTFSIKFNINSNNIDYKFLGITFMKMHFSDGYSVFKLFKFIKFRKKPIYTAKFLLPIFIEILKQQTGMEALDIIPLQYRLGESQLFLYNLKEFIAKNNIKNPVIISARPYLRSLCEMLQPNIPFIQVSPHIFNLHWANIPAIEYKNCRYFQNLTREYFINYKKDIQCGCDEDFYTHMLKELKLTGTQVEMQEFPLSVIDSATTKMNMLGLKKPFVFISPNAQSNGTMSKTFWEKLPVELFKLGYDMFFNEIPWNIKNTSYKHCPLSIVEAKFIAEQADVVIGVRSGLIDIISSSKAQLYCVYHAFFNRKELPMLSAEKVKKVFSLEKIPFTNFQSIKEYNGELENEDLILTDIVDNLSKKEG